MPDPALESPPVASLLHGFGWLVVGILTLRASADGAMGFAIVGLARVFRDAVRIKLDNDAIV